MSAPLYSEGFAASKKAANYIYVKYVNDIQQKNTNECYAVMQLQIGCVLNSLLDHGDAYIVYKIIYKLIQKIDNTERKRENLKRNARKAKNQLRLEWTLWSDCPVGNFILQKTIHFRFD